MQGVMVPAISDSSRRLLRDVKSTTLIFHRYSSTSLLRVISVASYVAIYGKKRFSDKFSLLERIYVLTMDSSAFYCDPPDESAIIHVGSFIREVRSSIRKRNLI